MRNAHVRTQEPINAPETKQYVSDWLKAKPDALISFICH